MCKFCDRINQKYFQTPQKGDLRVWWIPQVPGKPFHYPVSSIAEAKHMLNMLADYDLFQWKHMIKPDYANAGGLQVFESGRWFDWENEWGDGIDEVDENGKTLED